MKRINRAVGSTGIAIAQFDLGQFLEKLLGKGWKPGMGLLDHDKASSALREVDLAKAEYLSCLVGDESSITFKEKSRRIRKQKRIMYGATVFAGLWNDYLVNGATCALERIYEDQGITHVFFMGDVIESPDGESFILYIFRDGPHHWKWLARRIDAPSTAHCLAMVSPVVS
jgi:hypothetical protein